MANGVMTARMARSEDDEQQAGKLAAAAGVSGGNFSPADGGNGYLDGEGRNLEPDESDDEQAVEQVLTAAVLALRNPEAKQGLMEAAQGGAQAIADEAYNLMVALDERSGATIPEAALIPAGIGVVGIIAEIVGADEATVAQAAALALERFFVENGMPPDAARQALRQADLSAAVSQARAVEQPVEA